METSGAYQLIDDQTGQKFIVWGGGDDTDHSSSLPSQQLLPWNPKPQQEGTGIGVTPAAAAAAASAAAYLPSFARLKAPKIKSLIHNKSSSSKTATAIGTKVKQMVIPAAAAAAAAAAAHSDSFRETK